VYLEKFNDALSIWATAGLVYCHMNIPQTI
jgi:hypothetical protein